MPATLSESSSSSWFFIGWYHALTQSINASWNWLFPGVHDVAEPAVRELIRRHLSQKSWFDTMTSSWVELPFWHQVLSVAAVVLVGGLLGLIAHAPLICALGALSVFMISHVLCVAHEHSRWNRAVLVATEATALCHDLEACKTALNKSTIAVNNAAEELKKQSAVLIERNQTINQYSADLEQQNTKITGLTEALAKSTATLMASQGQVAQEFDKAGTQAKALQNSMKESTVQVEAITATTTQLAETVGDLKKTEALYSDAVSRFSLFAESTQKRAAARNESVSHSSLSPEQLAAMDVQLEAAERLMAQHIASRQAVGMA